MCVCAFRIYMIIHMIANGKATAITIPNWIMALGFPQSFRERRHRDARNLGESHDMLVVKTCNHM